MKRPVTDEERKRRTELFRKRICHDTALWRAGMAENCDEEGLGMSNVRRVAMGEPMYPPDMVEALTEHLGNCGHCQRLVEIYRQVVREAIN